MITILGLLSFICEHVLHVFIHPLWLTGVGYWYLPINKELPSLCREYDEEELPAELTRTGKLVYMMNVVVVIVVVVYTINDISSQWTRTVDIKLHVPYLTIREMEKKRKE